MLDPRTAHFVARDEGIIEKLAQAASILLCYKQSFVISDMVMTGVHCSW